MHVGRAAPMLFLAIYVNYNTEVFKANTFTETRSDDEV